MKDYLDEEQFRKRLKSNIFSFNHMYGGFDNKKCQSKSKCPIFKDYIPYKSFTIIVSNDQFDNAVYWCEYMHGVESVWDIKQFDYLRVGKHIRKNQVAIRSDYQCW